MKKLILIRYPLFAALSLLLGIFATVLAIYDRWYFSVAIVAAVLTIALLLYIKGNQRVRLVAIVLTIALTLGIITSALSFARTEVRQVGSSIGTISGYITDDITDYKYSTNLCIRNASFTDVDGNTRRLDGLVEVYFTDNVAKGCDIQCGNKLTVVGAITDVYIFRQRVNSYPLTSRINYTVEDVDFCATSPAKPHLDEISRMYIKDRFSDMVNAEIAYALVVGDKTDVAEMDKINFSNAGIYHVLAVSGLHVGFISLLLNWLLDRLKVKRKFKIPIILIPLIFYAYICDFTASVVRATIMMAVVLVCELIFSRVDSLSSLSTAVFIILLLRPFDIYTAGFVLSVAAVFGVICFSMVFLRMYRMRYMKSRLLKGIVTSVLLSLGVTVASFTWCAHYFGYMSTMSAITNLVAIPLVTVAYILLLISLLPFMKFILLFPDRILQLVRTIAHYIGNLPFSTVTLLEFGIAVIVLGLWLFVFGGHVNFSQKAKRIALVSLAVVFVALSVVNMVPRDTVMEVYIPETYTDEMFVLATDNDNGAYVFSNTLSDFEVNKVFEYLLLKRVDNLYIFSTQTYTLDIDNLKILEERYGITQIYSLDGSGNLAAKELWGSDLVYFVPPNQPTFTPIAVTPVYIGIAAGFTIDTGQLTVCVVTTTNHYIAASFDTQMRGKADVVYSNFRPELFTGHVITRLVRSEPNIYSITKHGAFTFHTKSDTIDM
jgi:ComEC/Rec2-related protein